MKILDLCIDDYNLKLSKHKKEKQYYDGITDMREKYIKTDRSNLVVEPNFMKQLIDEELSYLLGNKIAYISKTSNSECIEDIKRVLYNWSNKHDRNLSENASIYSEAYELYYIDKDAKLKSRICTPLNSYVYRNENDEIEAFIYFYKKLFDDTLYLDVYEANKVTHYKGGLEEISQDTHIFPFVPISILTVENTIFYLIKSLQDAYGQILSDLVNEIADNRNAYLIFDGEVPDEETLTDMKRYGAIGGGVDVKWLVKEINDTFVQNTLTTLEKNILKVTSHIDFQEKLQSNSSSLALRTRLISLENRVKRLEASLRDCLEDRIVAICHYLKVKENKNYDPYDIEAKITLSLPNDDVVIAQIASQLSDRISTETILSQLSFVDNPLNELDKIANEKESSVIDLDRVDIDE